MIVIYTGDVEKAENTLEMPCFTLKMEQVFIRKLPKEEIYQSIETKLNNNESLSDKELMQLIVLPLAKRGKEEKQRMIEKVVDLAKQIESENTQYRQRLCKISQEVFEYDKGIPDFRRREARGIK